MRVYLSSTYEDLRLHRAAVAAALRRMGHIVIGMEDYVAECAWPLDLCVQHIGKCDVLVGIIAWRYGFVPAASVTPPTAMTPGTSPALVSIVESEIQAAVSAKKDVLMFLLDPKSEWPAHLIDAVSGAGDRGVRVAELRKRVSEAHVVAFFHTPEELAGLAVVALYRLEINRQIGFQSLKIGLTLNAPFRRDDFLTDTSLYEIQSKVSETFDALSINIGAGTEWWSTRLYFLASLAADLLETAAMVFLDDSGQFIGMVPPRIVKERLADAYPPLRAYEQAVGGASRVPDLRGEVARRAGVFMKEIDNTPGQEARLKVFVTAQALRSWFGDVMVAQALDVALGEPSIWDIQRIIEWPMRYVPISEDGKFTKVVDRQSLAEQVAKLFVREQGLRARSFTF